MALSIETVSPLSRDGLALIHASEAALREVYPPEECFSFSPAELNTPQTTFIIARLGNVARGCAALVDMGEYGEIKRMYVDPAARGTGVARAMFERLEAKARDLGLSLMRLETGHELRAAVALYRRLGFADCPAFGGYPDIASNLFLEKKLAARLRRQPPSRRQSTS